MEEPNRPAITPASIVAIVVAGVPVVANLLAAFNVVVVTAAQQHALTEALTWGGVLAGVLLAHDAVVRTARNKAVATVQEAALYSAGQTQVSTNQLRVKEGLPAIVPADPDADPPGDSDALPDHPTTDPGAIEPDVGDVGGES